MNIRFFNETNEDERNIYLTATNEVTNVDIVAVNWVHPSGTFRIKGNTVLTHFIADFNARRYIYRITSYTAINGEVLEYAYTLDYMKTYFYHKQFTELNKAIVSRSTNVLDFAPFIPDNERSLSGAYTVNRTNGNVIDNVNFILLMSNPLGVSGIGGTNIQAYVLDRIGFWYFQKELLTNIDAKTIYSQVKSCYMLFDTLSGIGESTLWGITLLDNHTISYTTPRGLSADIDVGEGHCKQIFSFDNPHRTINSGLSVTLNNYEDVAPYSIYKLYTPFYGQYEIPQTALTRGSATALNINYYWNIFDGTISVQLNDDITTRTTPVNLPTINLLSSDYTLQKIVTENSYETNSENINLSRQQATISAQASAVSSGISAGMSFALGNVAGGLMGTAGMIGNMVTAGRTADISQQIATNTNETNYNNSILQLNASGLSNSAGTGYNGLVNNTFVLSVIKSLFITSLSDFASVHGYICNKTVSNITFGGFKYWLSTNNMIINQNEELALSDISRRYIMGNIDGGIWWDNGTNTEHNPLHPAELVTLSENKISLTGTYKQSETQTGPGSNYTFNITKNNVPLVNYKVSGDYTTTADVSTNFTESQHIIELNSQRISKGVVRGCNYSCKAVANRNGLLTIEYDCKLPNYNLTSQSTINPIIILKSSDPYTPLEYNTITRETRTDGDYYIYKYIVTIDVEMGVEYDISLRAEAGGYYNRTAEVTPVPTIMRVSIN